MTKRQFLKDNREEIDQIIRSTVPEAQINDEERWMWVMNDEGLYLWAKREGVRV